MSYKRVSPDFWIQHLLYPKSEATTLTIDVVRSLEGTAITYCRWTTWIEKV